MSTAVLATRARAAAIALALLASGVVWFMTSPPAPGITGDSFFYLGAANSLVRHGQLAHPNWRWIAEDSLQPMTRTTPGLSLALAGGMALGASAITSARIVQTLSAAATVGLATLIVAGASGPFAGMLVGLSILALPAFNLFHLYILTEPLFLAALVCALWALIATDRPGLAGLALLTATATRYVGISFALGAGLATLMLRDAWSARVARLVKLTGPSLLFFGAWRLWTRIADPEHGIRVSGIYPLGADWSRALESIVTWIAPGSTLNLQACIVSALTACALAIVLRSRQRVSTESVERRSPALAIITCMLACYAIFVILARVFAEPTIALGTRMFLPVYVLLHLLAGIVLPDLLRTNRAAQTFAAIAFGTWLIVSLRVSTATIAGERTRGLDVASEVLRKSQTLDWLRRNQPKRALFTNHPLAIYHHAGRYAQYWPARMLPDSAAKLRQRLRSGDGLIVMFRNPDPYTPVASIDEISSRVPLRPVATFADADIYELEVAPPRQ
jgi:hypothetical protein